MASYYAPISVGPSHNYYLGRAEADSTAWVDYFIGGMATAFEKVQAQAERQAASGAGDGSALIRRLDARQRKVLTLFESAYEVTTKDVASLLGFQSRNAGNLCRRWVASGFLVVADPSNRGWRYRLADAYAQAFELTGALPPQKL